MGKRLALRSGWLLWLLCASLSWSACQPYLDHPGQTFFDDFEAVNLGPKRPLELIDLRTDRNSVLFVFNQPLRQPQNEQWKPPFEVTFEPPLAVHSTEFEGLAGVRVTFVSPLPLSSSFTAAIPPGWRAPTGVSLWYPCERRWTTPRPALLQTVTQNGLKIPLAAERTSSAAQPGSSLTLLFNQPVALSSVRSSLRWERVQGAGGKAVPVPFHLTELAPSPGELAHQKFLLRSGAFGDDTAHRLILQPGVRGLKGPLRSELTQSLQFQPRPALRYLGTPALTDLGRSLTLRFSAPVRPEEVARCLTAVPESGRPRVSQEPGQPSNSVSLSFSGPVPTRVVLLAGLASVDGAALPADLAIGLFSPSKKRSKSFSRAPFRAQAGSRPERPGAVGFLRCDRPFYGPGETVVLTGFRWHHPIPTASTEAKAQVLSDLDRSVLETSFEVDSRGFFLASFKAPKELGLYRLRVTLASGGKSMESDFRVCPLAEFGESYSLVVEAEPQSAVIGLRREGSQSRRVGVRAYLLPLKSDTDQSIGWTALSERVPYWLPLSLTSPAPDEYAADFERTGGWSGGLELVAEAFDLENPRLVLCRETRQLAPTRPQLDLQIEPQGADPLRQSVCFQFLPDGAVLSTSPTVVKASLMYRAQGSDEAWSELDSRPLRIEGEKQAWPLRLPGDGDYQLRVEWKADGEAVRKAVWERSVTLAELSSPLDPSSAWGTVSLDVGRQDRAQELVRGDDDLSVRVLAEAGHSAWSGTLSWTRLQPGWDVTRPDLLSSYLGQQEWSPPSPDGYPLLSVDQLDSTATWGGINVEPETKLDVPAPQRAGSYLFSFIGRDAAGYFTSAETRLDVGDASRWDVLVPWGVRPGDTFGAGIRFLAGSGESGPIGLVATASGQDALLPSTYTRTNGVVKPGEEQLLRFDYNVPQKPNSGSQDALSLGWQLGYQGLLASLRAEVPIWSSLPVAVGSGRSQLNPGGTARIRVNGPLRWRVVLEAPASGSEDTLVSVDGPRGTLGKVLLRSGEPAQVLEGPAPGTVQIKHLRGAPLSLQMFRLQPDLGQTRAWGSGAYLFRALLDEQRVPITDMVLGQSAAVSLDLVNPARMGRGTLRLPLPAGVMPLSVESFVEGETMVPWHIESGGVVLSLQDLKPGEYRWLVNVKALTSGDFLWPTARVITADGQLQALSGSDRVRILDRQL